MTSTLFNQSTQISNLHTSEALNSLQLFDSSKIKSLATNALQGDQNSAGAILSMITIEKFL